MISSQRSERAASLLVLADDLTGANDAGVQFALREIPTLVLVESEISEIPRGFEVVVINTASRHILPDAAAARV